jgi:hypothetical protein
MFMVLYLRWLVVANHSSAQAVEVKQPIFWKARGPIAEGPMEKK